MAVTRVVKQGDTLNKIAAEFGFSNFKDAQISGFASGNPNLIRPGETLTIGAAKAKPVSVVSSQQARDTLDTKVNETSNPSLDKQARIDSLKAQISDKKKLNSQKLQQQIADKQAQVKEKRAAEEKAQADAESPVNTIDTKINDLIESQVTDFGNQLTSLSSQVQSLTDKILSGDIDESTANTIADVESTYERRIEKQNEINDKFLAGLRVVGIREGRAVGAPSMMLSEIFEEEQEQLEGISEIESEKSRKLQEIRDKAKEGDRAALSDLLDSFNSLTEKSRKLQIDYLKDAKKNNQALDDRLQQSRREAAILTTLDAGVTDPNRILQTINSQLSGNPVTFDEVMDIIKQKEEAENPDLDVRKVGSALVFFDKKGNIVKQVGSITDSSKSENTTTEIQSFEDFAKTDAAKQLIDQMQQQRGQTLLPSVTDEALRQVYNRAVDDLSSGFDVNFTADQKRDLNAAALSGASVNTQRFFLSTENAFQNKFSQSVLKGTVPKNASLNQVSEEYDKYLADKENGGFTGFSASDF